MIRNALMRPMFSYFGSKYNLAKLYGKPKHNLVIEPFAGSACYSLYWNVPKAILIDPFPQIIGIWQFLIKATEREIMSLPVDFDHVDDLKIPQEAKWLIGYWVNASPSSACKSYSLWARSYRHGFWGDRIKCRIASQLSGIRNWDARLGDYSDAPDVMASWFIDPPYYVAGKHYVFNKVNYAAVASFCRSRKGQVFVCENAGANWLPFVYLHKGRGLGGKYRSGVTHEVVWTNGSFTRFGAPQQLF